MKSGQNWSNVEAAGNFPKVPAGGYVAVITKVEDDPVKGCLKITYDIAEGDWKGVYKDSDDWLHTTWKYYTGKAAPFFKKFLEALEGSNNGFDIEQWSRMENENDFVGLLFGAVIQERYYTSEKDGKDKTALEVADVVTIYDIRGGTFKMPEPRDERKNVTSDGGNDAYGDVSFN